jgi:hypothetical protein
MHGELARHEPALHFKRYFVNTEFLYTDPITKRAECPKGREINPCRCENNIMKDPWRCNECRDRDDHDSD